MRFSSLISIGGLVISSVASKIPRVNFRGSAFQHSPSATSGQEKPSIAGIDDGLIVPQSRLIAIGDLHGDYKQAMRVFRLTGVTDKKGNWIGGSHTIVVQTGDVTDRGDDAKKLYEWIMEIQFKAEQAGGKFIMLLGNHEYMNMIGNYRYVSKSDLNKFHGKENRKLEFGKYGEIGRFLRGLNITAHINGTLFVHGGINKDHFPLDIHEINKKNHELMEVVDSEDYFEDERSIYKNNNNSPFWYRGYYKEPEEIICRQLQEVLFAFNAQRMVMGHCITKSHKIETRCSGKAIFIDVGMSKAFSVNGLAALELTENSATAIDGEDGRISLPFAK